VPDLPFHLQQKIYAGYIQRMYALFTHQQLLNLNAEGLIPGPDENEEDFAARSQYCLNLKTHLVDEMKDKIPFVAEEDKTQALLKEVFPKTKILYDIAPSWIPLFFSNYKLSPWHGGCAWIFQQKEDTPLGAFFQLRQAFRNSSVWLGIYKREELIAHEVAHVGRMKFEEPIFEEFLAYRSSSSGFRRYFGPIIAAPWESLLFVFILLIIFIVDISFLTMGYYPSTLSWLKMVPLLLILFAISRLVVRQNQLKACLRQIEKVVETQERANAMVYRLQDKEIILFGSLNKDQIRQYAERQTSLRWEVISRAYLQKELGIYP
jgi:hypothetical protein